MFNINLCFINNKRQLGATLIEVMVSTAVFSLISLSLMIIFNFGVKSWRNVEARVNAELSLNAAAADLNNVLRNSSADNIIIGPLGEGGAADGSNETSADSSSGFAYICCPSAALYDSSGVGESATGGFFTNRFNYCVPTNEGQSVTKEGISWNYWVCYFVAKQAGNCPDCLSLWNGDSDCCPHKLLIKRWCRADNVDVPNDMAEWSGGAYCPKLLADYDKKYNDNKIHNDKILSKNIMAFKAQKNNDTILFSIKVFKPNINNVKITEDNVRDSIDFLYRDLPLKNDGFYDVDNSAVERDPLSSYTVQVDGAVTPLNTYAYQEKYRELNGETE